LDRFTAFFSFGVRVAFFFSSLLFLISLGMVFAPHIWGWGAVIAATDNNSGRVNLARKIRESAEAAERQSPSSQNPSKSDGRSTSDSGLWIVLRSLGMGLPFLLDFGHHCRLLRCVRDMATVDTLIAARLSRLWRVARLRLHLVEDVKFITVTVETLQGQSSVHEPRLLDARGTRSLRAF
jgi:hypothetical protein